MSLVCTCCKMKEQSPLRQLMSSILYSLIIFTAGSCKRQQVSIIKLKWTFYFLSLLDTRFVFPHAVWRYARVKFPVFSMFVWFCFSLHRSNDMLIKWITEGWHIKMIALKAWNLKWGDLVTLLLAWFVSTCSLGGKSHCKSIKSWSLSWDETFPPPSSKHYQGALKLFWWHVMVQHLPMKLYVVFLFNLSEVCMCEWVWMCS